jgi:hypothetical protein
MKNVSYLKLEKRNGASVFAFDRGMANDDGFWL